MRRANPEETTLYRSSETLHELHWKELAKRDPAEAAKSAAASWDGRLIKFRVAGKEVAVDLDGRKVTHVDYGGATGEPVSYQRGLVAVDYLAHALEAEPSGRWISFLELPGGSGFFRGPHVINTKGIEKAFGENPQALVSAAEGLGGTRSDGGDFACEVRALPRIPVKVILWRGSEEFSPSAQMLIDARANLHIPALDVVWALSNIVVADMGSALLGR